MKIPTTLDRKKKKKWLIRPTLAAVLALLLVLCSLPVYAGEQQTEQTETPTVTQDTGSESVESTASSEQDEFAADELDIVQPIDPQEEAVTATTELTEDPPHEGAVLHGGYVGFKNKASGKYLTVPGGATTSTTNVCQQAANAIANAQEFYLSYTHNAQKNISYFTILPVDSTGATTQMRVKASAINASGVANVSLQYFLPTEFTDRWQIKHAYGNYYYIYLASNPNDNGNKYALTANPGEGFLDGTSHADIGNVYVSLYTGSNNQLWQICVNNQDIDINGVNVLDDSEQVTDISDSIQYFYVPKHYNTSTNWICYSKASIDQKTGIAVGLQYGTTTVSVAEIDSGGFFKEYHSVPLHIVPSNGIYYIGNQGMLEYISLQSASTGMIRIFNKKFSTNDIEKWHVVRAADDPGYVYLISEYSDMYMTVDSANTSMVRQCPIPNDYSLWKLDTSSQGNIIFKCKGIESSNLVLTIASGVTSSESPVSMATYSNNSIFLDEWGIFSFGDYTVNLSILYDYSYNNRFTDAEERIENQFAILQRKYLEEFGILVDVSGPTVFTSYVDANCSTNPTQLCSHTTDFNCDNSVTCTDGTILFEELHHNNVYNMLLHTPLTDMSESLRLVYLGHEKCSMGTVMVNGITTRYHVPSHETPLGLAYTKLGLCGVMNFGTPSNETKTMLHEFGHLYGVDDHYGGNGKTTQELISEGKTGYSEYCIYGEQKDSEEVLENYTICDGCKSLIASNYNRYDH